MVEVLGAVTAIGMAAATARFGIAIGGIAVRVRDELRFSRCDRFAIDRLFARVIAEQAPLDD